MAIRTITDLPDISTAADLSSKLSASRMEISLLADKDNSVYMSRSVSCGVLAEAIAADILDRQLLTSDSLDLNGHLTVKDGLSASGNFYANANKEQLQHDANLNFANVSISSNSFIANANDGISLSCGNAAVILQNDANGKGIVSLTQYATVKNVEDQDDYVVNVKFLKQKLDELSNQIMSDINSGKVQFKADIDFPLLGVIYIDHQIPMTNTAWAIAGSTVDLTKHQKLKNYIESDDIKNKLRMDNAGGNDTWSYANNGNSLKLPTTDWFFQSIRTNGAETDNSLTCRFIEAGLPQHTHSYSKNGSWSCPLNTSSPSIGKLVKDDGCYTTGKASNSIYKDNIDTVQPNATKMFVYFYVGQETA